jgi:polyphosphate glucokinase
MRVLVVDVGGTHVKLMHSGSSESRKFDSGDGFTAAQVVAGIKAHTADWT